MAQLCVANFANSSITLASRLISVICLNCTFGKACPVCSVDADDIEVTNISLVRITTSSSPGSL
eukprot:6620889-Prorocentrum_lima.AAC.1